MGFVVRTLFLFGALVRLSSGQNCPILGPAYPTVTNPASSPVLNAAKTAFDKALAEALSSSGPLANNTASFSLQVFSIHDEKPIYEAYHTAPSANGSAASGSSQNVGPDTLYRIGSISKLVSVYAILSRLSERYWNEPVTKYVRELAVADRQRDKNAVDDIRWSEITLGDLASHMSGIGRDYALGDVSATFPGGIPGLPVLNETDIVKCGTAAVGLRGCTRAEAMAMIVKGWPVSPSYHTPNYSNMAFQLLAYAVEKITGQSFASLVKEELLTPLGLTRTFLSAKAAANATDAVIVDGWTSDLGDEEPAGAYIQSVADLSRMGRSILNSSLLSPRTTRKWLKPIAHTASLYSTIGRPWEILRRRVPVAASSNVTRITDVYSKGGALTQYLALLALLPDHGIGISLLVGGPSTGVTYGTLTGMLTTTWLQAAEHAAREQASANFAGNYVLTADNSSAQITLLPDEPGLFVASFVSNGTDLFESLGGAAGAATAKLGGWLYPTTLVDRSKNGNTRVAFRARFGAPGEPVDDFCESWGSIDGLRYGGRPADLFVFEVGKKGRAVALEVPMLKKTLRRAD